MFGKKQDNTALPGITSFNVAVVLVTIYYMNNRTNKTIYIITATVRPQTGDF